MSEFIAYGTFRDSAFVADVGLIVEIIAELAVDADYAVDRPAIRSALVKFLVEGQITSLDLRTIESAFANVAAMFRAIRRQGARHAELFIRTC